MGVLRLRLSCLELMRAGLLYAAYPITEIKNTMQAGIR